MDIIIAGVLSFSLALILVLRTRQSLIYSHLSRGNRAQSILPYPATSSIREPTAPSRTGECVRGRLVHRSESSSPFPLSLPSCSSLTAFARTFTQAIVHAGLLTAIHSIGNHQPAIITLVNWILTMIYILLTHHDGSVNVTPIVSDDTALSTDPMEGTISIDVERELQAIQPPQPTYAYPHSRARRLTHSIDVPSAQGLPLPPRRRRTAPG